MLYNPRIILSEDDFDIMITTMINYDIWEMAPVETHNYLTEYCPEVLDRFAFPIYGVLLGKITVEDAFTYIEEEVHHCGE